ncbi:unnamed protein product [Rhizophagus irregularis]|nr:unnamed protein product [Rhizophagus irregularis]
MSNNHIPTILIIGAGLGGLLLYHGIQKHLNKNVKKFNVVIFERDIGPQDRWQGLRDLMLEGVNIQWGKKCIGYDEFDDEVWAIFQDGTRVRGDILIGCDGINSSIRKQRLPHLQLFDYGITQILIDGTLTYNPPRRRPVQDINPMSVEAWESTRVTLLGDAIHAMNPFLGYGANNALQDAESLVKCLSNYEKDGYKNCIREYENEMRVRSSRDVLESRENCLTQNLPKSKYGYLFNDIYLSGKL